MWTHRETESGGLEHGNSAQAQRPPRVTAPPEPARHGRCHRPFVGGKIIERCGISSSGRRSLCFMSGFSLLFSCGFYTNSFPLGILSANSPRAPRGLARGGQEHTLLDDGLPSDVGDREHGIEYVTEKKTQQV